MIASPAFTSGRCLKIAPSCGLLMWPLSTTLPGSPGFAVPWWCPTANGTVSHTSFPARSRVVPSGTTFESRSIAGMISREGGSVRVTNPPSRGGSGGSTALCAAASPPATAIPAALAVGSGVGGAGVAVGSATAARAAGAAGSPLISPRNRFSAPACQPTPTAPLAASSRTLRRVSNGSLGRRSRGRARSSSRLALLAPGCPHPVPLAAEPLALSVQARRALRQVGARPAIAAQRDLPVAHAPQLLLGRLQQVARARQVLLVQRGHARQHRAEPRLGRPRRGRLDRCRERAALAGQLDQRAHVLVGQRFGLRLGDRQE